MKVSNKSLLFLIFIAIETCTLCSFYLYDGEAGGESKATALQQKQQLAASLVLTDPALWTEARYTRHPSQTDFSSAFQDSPGSPDHFPAGSILSPVHPTQRTMP